MRRKSRCGESPATKPITEKKTRGPDAPEIRRHRPKDRLCRLLIIGLTPRKSSNDENLLLFRDAGPLAEEYRKAFVQPLGAEAVKRSTSASAGVVLLAFFAGFLTHVLYQRLEPGLRNTAIDNECGHFRSGERRRVGHPSSELCSLRCRPRGHSRRLAAARGARVEKIRGLTGRQARIRGRVFRVGHSAKSNTYFS